MNHLFEGGSGKVQEQTIESWMGQLREICMGYRLQAGADTDGCNRCSCNRQISNDANLAEIFSFLEHSSSQNLLSKGYSINT